MNYIKVKDKDHLYRDEYSMAIINNDHEGYQKYVSEFNNRYNQSKKIEKIENEVKSIRSDLDEIKNLLRSLTNGS